MTVDTEAPLQPSDLDNFSGTETWWRHWLGNMTYTDGVKFFAERAGAHWFLDVVATEYAPMLSMEPFMHIVLVVFGNKANIAVGDGNGKVLKTKDIDYTDCPPGTWSFYLESDVLCLPGER